MAASVGRKFMFSFVLLLELVTGNVIFVIFTIVHMFIHTKNKKGPDRITGNGSGR